MADTSIQPLKQCTKCNRQLPLTCFVKDKQKSDGLYSSCKECVSIRQKEESRLYPERIKDRRKRFSDNNSKRVNEERRKRYATDSELASTIKKRAHDFRVNNPESAKAIDKRKYEKYKEEYKIIHREYYLNNRDVLYAIGHRYRARKRNLPSIFNASDWKAACDYFNDKCAICGNETILHADHWIPLTSSECPGTVVWNIVPLCKTCNCSKKATNALEWILRQYDYETGMAINSKIESFLLMKKGN